MEADRVPLRYSRLGSIRTRVVVGYVVLIGIALFVTLLIVRGALIARYDADVDDRLASEVQQLERVIEEGDPDSGAAFDDLEVLFETHLRRVLPADDDAFYALVEGDPFKFSFDPPSELLSDGELVDRWAAVSAAEFQTVNTDAGRARVLVVPVSVADSEGTFVVAAFTDAGRNDLDDVFRTVAIVGALVLLGSALVAFAIAGRIVAPIRELTAVARGVTDADLSARLPLADHTVAEVAELSATFNSMMQRLEDGFATQRRFLDDVAHELRTPITIIQGHLDVLGDDPVERDQTVALLTDELTRMNRYVDDLLVLAQSERPDFLQPAVVDLDVLLDDLRSKASGLAVRDWAVDERPGTSAIIDRHRMTQAVLNLAENAVRHTDDGDEIGLSICVRDGRVLFGVRDVGPGIDPALADELFERHVRSATSRTVGGVGLGLSIVDAITVAHGGEVAVESVSGSGATFTISIPHRRSSETSGAAGESLIDQEVP